MESRRHGGYIAHIIAAGTAALRITAAAVTFSLPSVIYAELPTKPINRTSGLGLHGESEWCKMLFYL